MAEPVDLPKSNVSLPLELRTHASRYLSRTDETVFRLEKLLSTTTGLETVLAPLNYTLHLLIYIQSRKASPLRLLTHLLLRLRSRSSQRSSPLPSSHSTSNPSTQTLTHLNDLVTSSRNTLRLTALLPLYTYLRTLLSESQPTTDPTIHRINLLQAISYILYQLLENTAHLLDLSIPLPISITTTTATSLYLHSNRFWLLGLTCDLARLAREAVLERRGQKVNSVGKRAINRSAAEQEEVDQRWWNELLTASCWWPIVLNWSLKDGVRGVNDGTIGVLGVLGALPALKQQWEETKKMS